MSRVWRAATALALAVLAGAGFLTPALAAPSASGHIVAIRSQPGNLQVVVSAAGLANTSIGSSMQLRLNGTLVPVRITAFSPLATGITRTVLLPIDTSGSMSDGGLVGAVAAARQFLTAMPSDVRVGLIAFSATPQLLVAPTEDRAPVARALGQLQAGGETALFDAVGLAVRTLGSGGVRSILLLTDGGDTVSHLSLAQADSLVAASHDTLDAVGFRTNQTQIAALDGLAAAGHGRVIPASGAAGLASAFAAGASDLTDEVVLDAAVPAGLGGRSVTVQVSGSLAGQPINDSSFVQLADSVASTTAPSAAGPEPVKAGPVGRLQSKTVLYGALAAIFIALSLILATALAAPRRRSRDRRRRLLFGLGKVEPTQVSTLSATAVAQSALQLADRISPDRGFEERLDRRLEAAGLRLRAAEWLLLHAGLVLGFGVLGFLISGGAWFVTLLGLAIGIAAPIAFLHRKQSSRVGGFASQLPDTLQLIAGALSAGYSLPQAMDTAAREAGDPVGTELRKALAATRLGSDLEDGLEDVARRMDSNDFGWVVMSIRIQREVGGNLAEVLGIVADTLREREFLRRQVRVLSADGRLSAIIIGAMPFFFIVALELVRPSYMSPLFHTSTGVAALVVGAVFFSVGLVWLKRVAKVEV
jgi:tight adherence protein B